MKLVRSEFRTGDTRGTWHDAVFPIPSSVIPETKRSMCLDVAPPKNRAALVRSKAKFRPR